MFRFSRLLIAVSVLSLLAQAAPNLVEVAVRGRAKITKKSELYYEKLNEPEAYDATKAQFLKRERVRLMRSLRTLLRGRVSREQKGELGLRLAKVYLEEYYGRIAQVPTEKNGKRAVSSLSEAVPYLRRARELYETLAKNFPKHPRRDEMLYYVAQSYFDDGNVTVGIQHFKDLASHYPKSRYVNDADTIVGDYYFNANKFKDAEAQYQQVVQRSYAPLMAYAYYKIAWCRYNQGDAKGSLAQFQRAIQVEDTRASRASMRVKNEVAKDIAYPFADLGLVDKALAFYEGMGEPYYRTGLESMAALLRDRGQYPKAIRLWEDLLSLDPGHRSASSYELEIVSSLLLMNKGRDGLSRLEEGAPRYVSLESSWRKKNEKDTALLKDTDARWEEVFRKLALQYHSDGQKMKNESLYTTAARLYHKYLGLFPNVSFAPQARFNLADILYRRGEDEEAAGYYFEAYKGFTKTSQREESLRLAVAALLEKVNSDRREQKLGMISADSKTKLSSESRGVEAYSTIESRFFDVAGEYLKAFPNAKDTPEIFYEQAYLQYVHADLDHARKQFESLIATYPRHASAPQAAYLILDILNRAGNYDELVTTCQNFLSNSALTRNAGFRNEVGRVLRQTELKQVQLVEQKGEYEKAARLYLRYAARYGALDAALHETAVYNAAGNFVKAGFAQEAAETQEMFLRRFPKSHLRKDLILSLAKANESMAKFDRAARFYAQFAEENPTHPQARQALRLAGLYYWGSGRTTAGQRALKRYLDHYKAQANLVEQDLLEIYDSEGNSSRQLAFYRDQEKDAQLSPVRHVLAALRLAEAQWQRSGRLPHKLLEKTLDYANHHPTALKKDTEGAAALAFLRFWELQRKDQASRRVRVTERTLSHKLADLKQIEHDYDKIVKLGGEWGIAAIYETASAYQSVADGVMTAPVPRGLAAEQLDKYRTELRRTMVAPLQEKAASLAATCIDKANDHHVLTSWTARCYALANSLKPEKFPLRRTAYVPPMMTALLVPDDDGRTKIGSVDTFSYPYGAPLLFSFVSPERRPRLGEALDGSRSIDSSERSAFPVRETYQALVSDRREALQKLLDSAAPSEGQAPSFAYLNLLRLVSPSRAVAAIHERLERDSGSPALLNLLGLAYLESRNFPAAKVTWLSLMATHGTSGVVKNNLAVAAMLQGHAALASRLLSEASEEKEVPFETLANLGSVALRNFNGSDAASWFERATHASDRSVTAKVGLAEAYLQQFADDKAKDLLQDLATGYGEDPYLRLATAYYLIDVAKDARAAKQLLSEYLERHSVAEGDPLRRLLREANQNLTSRADTGNVSE